MANNNDDFCSGCQGICSCKPSVYNIARDAAIKELVEKAEAGKSAWMDSIHFDHHLENDISPQQVFVSEESLRESSRCIDTDGECTAKEVLIFDAKTFRAALANYKAVING